MAKAAKGADGGQPASRPGTTSRGSGGAAAGGVPGLWQQRTERPDDAVVTGVGRRAGEPYPSEASPAAGNCRVVWSRRNGKGDVPHQGRSVPRVGGDVPWRRDRRWGRIWYAGRIIGSWG